MMKQLFDFEGNVEAIELSDEGFLRLQQIKEYQPDILVGTKSEDSLAVLDMALENKISYAIFEPNLKEIHELLEKSLTEQYSQCGKILYLSIQDHHLLKIKGTIVHTFHQQGQLILEGDYMDACMQMAFDSIYWGIQIIN